MKHINHNQLKLLIKIHHKHQKSLMIWGKRGIGKSEVVRQSAKEIAMNMQRTYVEWNNTTEAQKQIMFKNPEKFFVTIDVRGSQLESSDIRGLPSFSKDNNSVKWLIPTWELYMTLENSAGILFLDELTLSMPSVLNSMYQIILDRVVDESKIAEGWGIVSASNLISEKTYGVEIPTPLRSRFNEVELMSPTGDAWVNNFAIPNNIDSRIIGYILSKESALFDDKEDTDVKPTDCRSWARLSDLIKDIEDFPTLELLSEASVGYGKEFASWVKVSNKLDLNKLIANPKLINEIKEIDVLYFIVSALAERYANKKLPFAKLMALSKELDATKSEFVALLWRLCMRYNHNLFYKEFSEVPNDKEEVKLRQKYHYLLSGSSD